MNKQSKGNSGKQQTQPLTLVKQIKVEDIAAIITAGQLKKHFQETAFPKYTKAIDVCRIFRPKKHKKVLPSKGEVAKNYAILDLAEDVSDADIENCVKTMHESQFMQCTIKVQKHVQQVPKNGRRKVRSQKQRSPIKPPS